MKILRSTRCSLKFTNPGKLQKLQEIISEYSRVVNKFVDIFWDQQRLPSKSRLVKSDLNSVCTWLTARLRKEAAREALGMVSATRESKVPEKTKPTHKGNRMQVCSSVATLQYMENATEFDAWVHLSSIGNKILLDLPVKFHRHFNRLNAKGHRLNSYILTTKFVQFVFEIEAPPRMNGPVIGIDSGIKTLAAISDKRQLGTDIQKYIERIKRCTQGSKGQQKARLALKHRMDEVAHEVIAGNPQIVVVETLSGMNRKTKQSHRLHKEMRKTLGIWAWRYWLGRLQQVCEMGRSRFVQVNPAYTSQQCHRCGHTERKNRQGEVFKCRKCDHTDNADLNAALNILSRYLEDSAVPLDKQRSFKIGASP